MNIYLMKVHSNITTSKVSPYSISIVDIVINVHTHGLKMHLETHKSKINNDILKIQGDNYKNVLLNLN